MHRTMLAGIFGLTALATLSGCSVRDVRDFVVDQTAPPHTSDLIQDVERTAEEIAAEEQTERAEELSAEYEEFLRENNSDSDKDDDEERSVIMVDPDQRY